jgi:hypothetical protein
LRNYKDKADPQFGKEKSMLLTKEIHRNASRIRCYKCGSPHIEYVCHHCGKPMCDKHVISALDTKGKLLSDEFTKLKLSNECGEEPYHCERCIHIVRNPTWKPIVAGVIVFLLSLMAIPNDRLTVKLFGLLTGTGLVGYGVYTNSKRKEEFQQVKPQLPVLPRFDQVQIQEKLNGHLSLNLEGLYAVLVSPVEGQLDVTMTLTDSDRRRLDNYSKKYGSTEKFHAGFMSLEGLAEFKLRNWNNSDARVIPLVDQVSNQPLLKGIDQRDSGKKQIGLSYSLLDKPSENSFPVQVVISFLSETDQQGIEIGIQWIKPESLDFELRKRLWSLEIEQIESLKLCYPASWGQVENLMPSDGSVVGLDSQIIIWNRVQIPEQNRKQCRYTFRIQFENRIDSSNSSVYGEVKVLFKGTLSGLKNVGVYFPTGKKIKTIQEQSTIKTEVHADFELSLASLRYQQIRQVPDPYKKEGDLTRLETLIFQNVSPNYATVTSLADAISEQGFYVKQQIENQPTINARTGGINRIWTIFGRWYDGVYPIDFQIDLRGDEESKLENQLSAGTTFIKLTVKGAYSNLEMERKIEDVWDRLNFLRCETLRRLFGSEPYSEQVLFLPSSEESSVFVEAELEEEDIIDDDETHQ